MISNGGPSGRRWRPGAPSIALAPVGFAVLFGMNHDDPWLSAATLAAYVFIASAVVALIVRIRVTVASQTLTVRRIRSRRIRLGDIAEWVLVPITFPGLRTSHGVLTAMAFNRQGSCLTRIWMRGWTQDQIKDFVAACRVAKIVEVSKVMTPRDASARWPGSFPRRSQWRGYVTLTIILLMIAGVAVGATWVSFSLPFRGS